jgi:NAD(P)-dependent dehydrogenase (short-subunit alcohol dehydrogenase family)
MNLKDKVVVITGSTGGLGKALACGFLNEQAKVVINSLLKKDVEEVSKEIGTIGFSGDVTKENDMKKLADFAVKKFGKIDVWINNAGIWLPHKPIEETDWKKAHDLMEVNLFGTVYGSKSALSKMRRQGSGSIINIISTSGLNGKINETAYCSSKFAVKGFTESLMKEVDEKKIKVIGVYPGRMRTNLFGENKPQNYDELMSPDFVAQKIIKNLKLDKPKKKLIIRKK